MADAVEMGLKVTGLVVAKSEYKSKSGIRKQVVAAIPGGSTNITVEVPEARYAEMKEMAQVSMRLAVSDYQGRLFFTERA